MKLAVCSIILMSWLSTYSLGANPSQGPLLGLEAVKVPLAWFDDSLSYPAYDSTIRELKPNSTVAVTSLGRPPMEHPVSVRLSRCVYPATDGHLDVIVRFDLDLDVIPDGRLVVTLVDALGQQVSQETITPIPGSQLFFSYRYPEVMIGQSGSLNVEWIKNDEESYQSSSSFEVSVARPVIRTGRIPLTVPNETGASLNHAPITVGVPFPRGVLESVNHLRLVDAEGEAIPLQTLETARWSRFGSVKWVQCDFTVDLKGGPLTVYLEYSPEYERENESPIPAKVDAGFPRVEAGRLRFDAGGVWFDPEGDGQYHHVLDGKALAGAFVQRTRGINYADASHSHFINEGDLYTMGKDTVYSVEEDGSEKLVVKAEGWYVNEDTGKRFCKFLVRYILFKDSPVVRIFHTWIFTGDGNRDTIRTMGWRFPLADMEPKGFLSSFDDAAWLSGYYLRQQGHDSFSLFEFEPGRGDRRMVWEDAVPERPLREVLQGGRAPGVMAALSESAGIGVYIGIQDFWQNFPSSLRREDDAFTFHQWPRYGREIMNPVYAGDAGNVWRLWFVHEGEALNFTLPQALTENPLYWEESRSEPHYAFGQPDSVNAQGIAKTAEMWLYFTEDTADEGANAVRVMEGLQRESIRAVVDPRWMTASGAFYEAGVADFESYPDLELAFRDSMLSPIRQVERMGVYGKWIYGDLLRTSNLDTQEAGLYRTFRKSHWGWPYSWLPFARSGDTDYLRYSQAATRMMTDTAFCHYVDEDLARYFANELSPRHMWTRQQPYRALGWNNRNLIPWAGYWGPSTRVYVDQADYLWDAWYLTGYHRARDIALTWADLTKVEDPEKMMRGPIDAAENRARWPANLQKQYIEMYEATWDPWFLAAAQAIAELHLWRFREEGYRGHFWHAGYLTWQRYSGCKEHGEFMLENAKNWADLHNFGWGTAPITGVPSTLYGYYATGDEYYLRRAAGVIDTLRWAMYSGDAPEYYRGFHVFSDTQGDLLFKSWLQLWYPWVIGAYETAGGEPEHPIYPAFDQQFERGDRLAVMKQTGEALELRVQGDYIITNDKGVEIMKGRGDIVTLPAEAESGVYFVELRGRKRLPVSPIDTPEVFIQAPGRQVPGGNLLAQYWFQVPEEVESFTIDFDNSRRASQAVRQIMIWNPEGEPVWAFRDTLPTYDPEMKTIRASVDVPPGQSGKLWRVTLPGRDHNMPFRLSDNLAPYLSHDPVRWFNPTGHTD